MAAADARATSIDERPSFSIAADVGHETNERTDLTLAFEEHVAEVWRVDGVAQAARGFSQDSPTFLRGLLGVRRALRLAPDVSVWLGPAIGAVGFVGAETDLGLTVTVDLDVATAVRHGLSLDIVLRAGADDLDALGSRFVAFGQLALGMTWDVAWGPALAISPGLR